jgi:glutaredoxin-like protein
MSFMQDKDRTVIQTRFEELGQPVKLINFTQEIECMYCTETRRLMEEIAELSDKVTLEVYNFVTDKEAVRKYSIDKIPATVVEGEKDYGIRFFGIPTGYEFGTLIEDIIMASKGDSGLQPETREALSELGEPVPQAVQLAHRFAIESDRIVADMVEATEFPHLAQRYNVMGVPKTVANEIGLMDGALPEEYLIASLMALAEPDEGI